MHFKNRQQAGRFLASKLFHYKDSNETMILALPRGGIPVAHEVAMALHLPWDVLVVRKIGLPGYRRLGIGAMALGGVEQIPEGVSQRYGVSDKAIQKVVEEERLELQANEHRYRDGLPFPRVTGKTVLLVDDGLATGSSMRAAVESVRRHGAVRVVVAVPVGSRDTCHGFTGLADETICAYIPDRFDAVGNFYLDFRQCSDSEIDRLLQNSSVGTLYSV